MQAQLPAAPSKPALEIRESGAHGLYQATWAQVRRAYRKLGAKPSRTTVKEQTAQYRFPNGANANGGSLADTNDQVHKWALANVIEDCRKGGVQTSITLAVLSMEGATWYQKPRDISILERVIKSEGIDVSNPEDRSRAIRLVSEYAKKSNGGVRGHELPAKSGDFPYTVEDAVSLLADDVTEDQRKLLITRLKVSMSPSQKSPLMRKLTEGDHVRSEPGKRGKVSKLTYEGAMMVARDAEQRAIKSGFMQEPKTKEPEPEPVEAAAKPSQNGKLTGEPRSFGASIRALGEHFGVEPIMDEDEIALDYKAMVIEMATKIGEKREGDL